MSAIYEALEKATLTSDGAMGTMLQDRGLTDGGAPEVWNVESPKRLRQFLRHMPQLVRALLQQILLVALMAALPCMDLKIVSSNSIRLAPKSRAR